MTPESPSAPLVLLDPFAGCGTAPLAGRMLGLKAIGYDPHPFFSIISEAKANSHRYWTDLPLIRTAIGNGLNKRGDAEGYLSTSAFAFLNKMFNKADLDALVGARISLQDEGMGEHPLAILVLSRMIDYSCFAATDGIYKAPSSTKRALSATASFSRVLDTVESDALEALSGVNDAKIYAKSSENMCEIESKSVDLVVTSPPYLNNFDFAEMTRMYLYFWGMADTWADISSKVRSKLIVNTTTALRGQKELQTTYRNSLPFGVAEEAAQVVDELTSKRLVKAGKKEYDFLIYPYLSQMQNVLRECARALKIDAPFHMMVSDAALYGVYIPAPEWLGTIMRASGFTDVQVEMVRPRGHRWVLDKREGSERGLGEYYVFGRAA
ncbi:site-specific DNA-methyltransferase [Sphingomonas endophytica]